MKTKKEKIENKQEIKSKISGFSPKVSTITLNVNGPRLQNIRQIWHSGFKKLIQPHAIYKKLP